MPSIPFQLRLAFSVLLTVGVFLNRSLVGIESPGVYVFQGCAVSAKKGKAYYPVVRANSRKIEVDTGSGLSRTSYHSPCAVEPKMVLTDRLIEVLEMKCRASLNKETRGAGSNQRGDRIKGGRTGSAAVEMGIRPLEGNGWGNSVHLSCRIRSPEDISGTYGLLVVAFDRLDPQTGALMAAERVAGAQYIGDLASGEVMDLGVDFSLAGFPLENSRYSFHLYSKNGEEIALTNSSGLRELSAEEYVKLKLRLEGFQ